MGCPYNFNKKARGAYRRAGNLHSLNTNKKATRPVANVFYLKTLFLIIILKFEIKVLLL